MLDKKLKKMKSIDDKNRTSQNLLNTTVPVFRVNAYLKFTESYKKVGAVRIKIKIALLVAPSRIELLSKV